MSDNGKPPRLQVVAPDTVQNADNPGTHPVARNKGGRPRGTTNQAKWDRELTEERTSMALEMRRAGMTYSQIRDQLGLRSLSGAFMAVQRALDKQRAPSARHVRELQLDRYEALLRTLWPRARQGDLEAMDRVTNLLARIDRLYGLERLSVEHSGAGGKPLEVQVIADVRQFVAFVGELQHVTAGNGHAGSGNGSGAALAADSVLPALPNGEASAVPPDV